MSKEPLYPHKTPSEMKAGKEGPKQESEVFIYKDEEDYGEFGYPYFPNEYPETKNRRYREILALPRVAKPLSSSHITYMYFPDDKVGYIEMIALDGYSSVGVDLGGGMMQLACDDLKHRGATLVRGNVQGGFEGAYYNIFKTVGFTLTEPGTGDYDTHRAVKYL